jgi:hypothetical protein
MSSSALFLSTVAALSGNLCASFRSRHGLCGYTVVGSAALLGVGSVDAGDVDVVLLSMLPAIGTDAAGSLRSLAGVLPHAVTLPGRVADRRHWRTSHRCGVMYGS